MRETKTRAASRGVGVGQRGGSTRAADANWPGNAAREWRWASGSRAPVAVLVSPAIAMALSLHYRLQSASLLPQVSLVIPLLSPHLPLALYVCSVHDRRVRHRPYAAPDRALTDCIQLHVVTHARGAHLPSCCTHTIH